VATGFEGHIESGGSGGIARCCQSIDFGMRTTKHLMPALPQDLAGRISNDRTDHGVWLDQTLTTAGQLKGTPHERRLDW